MPKLLDYPFSFSLLTVFVLLISSTACVTAPPVMQHSAYEVLEISDTSATFVMCASYDAGKRLCNDQKPLRLELALNEYLKSMDNSFGLPYLLRKTSSLRIEADRAKDGEKKKLLSQLAEAEASVSSYTKWRDSKMGELKRLKVTLNPDRIGGGSLLFLPFRSNKAACPVDWEWSANQKCCARWMNCRCEARSEEGLRFLCRAGDAESLDRTCYAAGEEHERQVCLNI